MTIEFASDENKTQTPGRASPVFGAVVCYGGVRPLAFSLDLISNSEGSQQDGADKKKNGAHRQDIEPQGKVHVCCLLG